MERRSRKTRLQPFEPTRWTQVAAMLPYTHVAFAPGIHWSYSNLGYVFLGQIIERLSGDDFEVYIDKNILKPLDMSASYFDRAPYFLQGHVSASYLRAGAAGALQPQPFDFDTGITTSSSAGDLSRTRISAENGSPFHFERSKPMRKVVRSAGPLAH